MPTVPRHKFVAPEYQPEADGDYPLPIGYGQTTSQPRLVQMMIELLELKPGDKVLEVGTGSGYETALLAELEGVEVYSVEIIPELAASAAERLRELGYGRVHLLCGNGYNGWPEYAPYDGIVVTAAPDHLPPPLVEQLAPGGRLVIPIGPVHATQTLWRYIKTGDRLRAERIGGVAFVPFTGEGTGRKPPRRA